MTLRRYSCNENERMKKDAYYFPHFSNARHDRKIQRLRHDLKNEGYALYFMLLETLREQPDYKYPINDIELLAMEFSTTETILKTVVFKYDLFTIDEDGTFYSAKLIEYLQPYLRSKEQRRQAVLSRWNKIKNTDDVNTGEDAAVIRPYNDRTTPVIQRKEKKRKENNINPLYPPEFETAWADYGRKGSKVKAAAEWGKLTPEQRERAEKHIPLYVQSREAKYRKDFERYLSYQTFESAIIADMPTKPDQPKPVSTIKYF